jgi:NADH-quinone oxidoreductase subunit M
VHSWIPSFGVSYALGVDGIALSLILMSAILAPVCILAAWHDVPEGAREKNYFALMLLLLTFMVGVFAATDVFLFYVFFEAMLIPVYFLIGSSAVPRRQYAAMKFLLFSLAGGPGHAGRPSSGSTSRAPRADGFLMQNLTGLPISTRRRRSGSSSASSSPSRSRRRCGRCTRGCPTPAAATPATATCSSACSTRSAPTA